MAGYSWLGRQEDICSSYLSLNGMGLFCSSLSKSRILLVRHPLTDLLKHILGLRQRRRALLGRRPGGFGGRQAVRHLLFILREHCHFLLSLGISSFFFRKLLRLDWSFYLKVQQHPCAQLPVYLAKPSVRASTSISPDTLVVNKKRKAPKIKLFFLP